MFHEICDSYIFENFAPNINLEEENKRYVTFEYDTTNENDMRIKRMIKKLLFEQQPLCEKCKYSKKIDSSYLDCEKHGLLDCIHSFNREHDGALCKDYKE